MNNPIKKYFQKIYNETGKKPFTFLNAFLLTILPLVLGYFISMALVSSIGEDEILIPIGFAIALAVGCIIDFLLLLKNFKGKAVVLLLLNIVASLLFFITFILWPVLKFAFRAGMAATQSNLGNTTASVNASRRAGATKGKKSALNWFEYTGRVWEDEKEVMPEDTSNYSLDEGSYTDIQNQQARAHGFENGKHAEVSGRKWNGTDWT